MLALLAGCQPSYEPNWLFRGQWIDVDGRDRDADQTCAGTFEYLDHFANAIAVEFGVHQHLGSYRWYSPEQYRADAPCGRDPEPFACASYDGVDTPALPHEHEIVHLANFLAAECPSVLEEGLADYYGSSGRTPSLGDLDRLPALLNDLSARILNDDYPAAARFVAYLVEQFGLDAILDVCAITGPEPSGDELARAMASVFGMTNEALFEDLARQPASCNAFEVYRSRVYACGAAEAAPDAGVVGRPGEPFEATYEFDCANKATIGPLDGEIWITERIDIAVAGSYQVALNGGSSRDDVPDVELRLAPCEPCGRVRSFGLGEIGEAEPLEAGRHWLEMRAPEDFRGTLTLTIVPSS